MVLRICGSVKSTHWAKERMPTARFPALGFVTDAVFTGSETFMLSPLMNDLGTL
jgi:hypothetical protein